MNWDKYWFDMCNTIAINSKCLSRKIGAIVVKDNKFIVSGGYNGPAIGCQHCDEREYREWLGKLAKSEGCIFTGDGYFYYEDRDCPRRYFGFKSSEGIKYCQAAHAERNAIDIAARLGRAVEGFSMYMNCGIPCLECAKSIVNSGISEVIVTDVNKIYESSGITGKDILTMGKVKIRQYDFGDN